MSPNKRERQHDYKVYRIRDNTPDNKILRKDPKPKKQPLNIPGATGTLYLYTSPTHTPPWVNNITPLLTTPINPGIASAGAVLIITYQGKRFAVTYGTGHSKLQPGTYEPLYGLRATLNAIDFTKDIRSVDRHELDLIPRHNRIQTTKGTRFDDFQFDPERQLLQAITGTPQDPNLGSRITGHDNAHLITTRGPNAITSVLRDIDDYAQRTTYKKTRPWLDQLQHINDPTTKDILDKQVITHLTNHEYDKVWLAIPTIIDWSDITFAYTPQGETTSDLSLEDYLTRRRPHPTPHDLHHDRIYPTTLSTNAPLPPWSLYQCLNAEITTKDGTYLLGNGQWTKVTTDFVNDVNNAVMAITNHKGYLPNAPQLHEPSYNKYVATKNKHMVHLDAQSIQHGGGHSKIEVADLYDTKHQTFVCVKQYGASSMLSYVFTQGHTASTLFANDHTYRTKIKTIHPKAFGKLKPLERPDTSAYTVVFGILTEQPRTALQLPFFCRLTLRNVHKALRDLGYQVGIQLITK